MILQAYLKTLLNNWCNTNPAPGWINISLQTQTPQRWAFIMCFSSACSLRHSWNQAAGCLRMLSRCWTRCYFGKSHMDGAIKVICLSLLAPCTEWRQTSSTLRATVGRAVAGLVGEMLAILHNFPRGVFRLCSSVWPRGVLLCSWCNGSVSHQNNPTCWNIHHNFSSSILRSGGVC